MLSRKGVYPYEYMDNWEKFNQTTLPEKEEYYSSLNMEQITDADYIHGKTAKILLTPGLAWQTALKKTEIKLELLTDSDMVEKGINGGYIYIYIYIYIYNI